MRRSVSTIFSVRNDAVSFTKVFFDFCRKMIDLKGGGDEAAFALIYCI